jgi:hypothetical protein
MFENCQFLKTDPAKAWNLQMWSGNSLVTRTLCVPLSGNTNIIILLISGFRRVLNTVGVLLGISPTSVFVVPTFRKPLSVPSSRAKSDYFIVITTKKDVGDIPKRTPTTSY